MAGGIPVMSEFQWARIVAKAYLDGTTGDLEKDPKQFVDGVRRADDPPGMKNLPDPVRLLNIDYSHYSGGRDSAAKNVLAIFQGSNSQQLQDLFHTGNFLGRPVEMPPGEWITDDGLTRLFLQSSPAITLTDWMRIYAYLWDQITNQGNTKIKEHFEEDPARTLLDPNTPPVFDDQVIAKLNASSPPALKISYTYQQTPLFTLGAPPPPGTLTDIRNNQGAMGYRHRLRVTC
jgi:hypothetical protein